MRAAQPIEKPLLERAFHLGDLVAQRRLRDEAALGGAAEGLGMVRNA
jgi:hypothetical protein